MTRWQHKGISVLATLLSLTFLPLYAAAKPRVVSLDSCSDQFIMALADDEQILALSANADLPFSYFREKAAHFSKHKGTAEDILGFMPDIALRTGVGDFALAAMLQRLGIDTIATGLPDDLEQVKRDILTFGEALDQKSRAQALIADIDRRLFAFQSSEMSRAKAIYLSPSGVTTGPKTFLGEVITLSGLDNQMLDYGLQSWGHVDLEALVQNPPEVIVGSFFDARQGMADGWRLADHPAIRDIFEKVQFIEVPSRLLGCPAWFVLDAVELIRSELEERAP